MKSDFLSDKLRLPRMLVQHATDKLNFWGLFWGFFWGVMAEGRSRARSGRVVGGAGKRRTASATLNVAFQRHLESIQSNVGDLAPALRIRSRRWADKLAEVSGDHVDFLRSRTLYA